MEQSGGEANFDNESILKHETDMVPFIGTGSLPQEKSSHFRPRDDFISSYLQDIKATALLECMLLY